MIEAPRWRPGTRWRRSLRRDGRGLRPSHPHRRRHRRSCKRVASRLPVTVQVWRVEQVEVGEIQHRFVVFDSHDANSARSPLGPHLARRSIPNYHALYSPNGTIRKDRCRGQLRAGIPLDRCGERVADVGRERRCRLRRLGRSFEVPVAGRHIGVGVRHQRGVGGGHVEGG